jgi:hypothetical protein
VGNLLVRFWEGQESNWGMEKILWHRRESRRETEKTNIFLQPREAPAYSNLSVVLSWHQSIVDPASLFFLN